MYAVSRRLGGGTRVQDLWESREEGTSGEGQEITRRLEVWEFW